MKSARKFSNLYCPIQPSFEKALNTFREFNAESPAIFNGGIKFSEYNVGNMNRFWVIPDGCLHLVICCHKEHPSANICGSLFKSREGIFARSDCDYFVVCFLPGYAEFFFKYPIDMFSESEVPVQDVLPHAEELLRSIAEQASLEDRVRAFERYYLNHFNETLQINPLINYLTEKIISCHGTLNVNELSRETGYSTRYILKAFEKHVGLPPKLFSRIIRFQHVIQLLENNQYGQTLDHIYELGYFDQNHFIKDFKNFSLLTPKKYVQHIADRSY